LFGIVAVNHILQPTISLTLEQIRKIALKLPAVTEDIKWENHLCFNVGGKMFVITAPDNFPVTASFKTTPELFEELTTKEGVIPAPYLARNKWVFVDNIERFNKAEWQALLRTAYDLVFDKLPVKVKKEITAL
jgi:predicted DNA-binding protein (MmcQ/YjbR family)